MYAGFIFSNNDITERVHDAYTRVAIINPVRMNNKQENLVHDKLIGFMPDVETAIADAERFYASRPGRYHREHTIYKRYIHEKGYDVYTILLDEDRQYDSQILSSAIAKICDDAAPSTKYRLVKESDVVDNAAWTQARSLLRTCLRQSDSVEFYEGTANVPNAICTKCAHEKVCKHLAMGAARPQCEHLLILE